jgi:hypothetical protein
VFKASSAGVPASLSYAQHGLDKLYTVTLVVEPTVPPLVPCGVAAVWHNDIVGIAIQRSGVERCASVMLELDGLHARGCGRLGDFLVPPPSDSN